MKIAFLHPFLFRYARGIERYTFNLANALVGQGVEVHLITWRWASPIQIDPLDSAVRVHILPTSRYYAAAAVVPFYVSHLLTQRYDFVWIYFAGYGEAEALALARWQRFGIVFHYPYALVPHRYKEFLHFGLIRRAEQVVSLSQFGARELTESMGLDSTVIPNGVDAEHFRRDAGSQAEQRRRLGLSQQDELLLTVAALEERKGIQYVVNALPKLLEMHPHLKYMIVGEGPYRATLEAQIQRLGLGNVARLVGAVQNIYPYYNVADVFLLLSIGEAFPIAPLEAMAMELPVVVSDSPPYDEIVDSRFGVRICEQGIGELVKAVDGLLTDTSRRDLMGSEGRTHACAEYSWQAIADRYLDLSRPRHSQR